jgi:protein TonB
MLNTKLNLYNPDWIELVFTNRNKSYGAYELRQHYALNMVKAMVIAFTTIVTAAVLYTYIVGRTPEFIDRVVVFQFPKIPPLAVASTKKIEEPVKTVKPAKPIPKVSTQVIATVIKPDELAPDDPIKNAALTGEISSKTSTGPGTLSQPVDPAPVSPGGTGVAPTEDKTVHDTRGLETMPEPVGGAAAWSKFLNRNLRFPSEAQDAGKSGRVLVSFVIEKDGRLSALTIENGAGFGMDEEALRVLRLAKPWKPGIQNGQPVRVRYTIPMNFQLSEQ